MRRSPDLYDPIAFTIGFAFGAAIALSVVLFIFADEFVTYMGWTQ